MSKRLEMRLQRERMRQRLEALRLDAALIVDTGKCPRCGSPLRRNLALAGWWQCEQFGDGIFRARPDDPKCTWQGFC